MTNEFEFEDAGRKFFCFVESPLHEGMPPWWWFRLETGDTTRYAPFAAAESDTKRSVQTRIVAHYAEVMAIKARPVHPRPVWRKPERPAAPPVAETPAKVDAA